MIKLRPHQLAAIAATGEHRARGHTAGCWSIPTGGGKTWAFLSVAKGWNADTLVLVHRDELVRQTVESAGVVWPEATVGVIQGPRNEWDGGLHRDPQIVVASVQSLHARRLEAIPRNRFDLVIADELHHYSEKNTWSRPLQHFDGREFLLGVSATPERADGEDLSRWFGVEPIYTYTLRQAIDDGMLARITQYAIETDANLDGVKNRMGDFAENQLAKAVDMPGRNRAIVEAYQAHAADRRAVAFCVNVEHAENLHGCFKQAGVNADFVHGGLAMPDRRERLARFAAGETRVMTSVMVLSEGWDDPGVDCAIMARPTQSRPLYVQQLGRALRLYPGKSDALVLDISDNCRRHNLMSAMHLMGALKAKSANGSDVLECVDEEHRRAVAVHEIPSEEVVSWRLAAVCPWPALPTLVGYERRPGWHDAPATTGQMSYLKSFGVTLERELTRGEASYLIDRCRELRAAHPSPATSRQAWFLRNHGAWVAGMTRPEASALISKIKSRQQQPEFA